MNTVGVIQWKNNYMKFLPKADRIQIRKIRRKQMADILLVMMRFCGGLLLKSQFNSIHVDSKYRII